MKNILSAIVMSVLFLLPGFLMAHSGHGDHTMILTAGELHPAMGMDAVLMVSALVAGVYLLLKTVRR